MTDTANTLAPDTDQTQQNLADNLNANAIVTAYAHAMINVQLSPIPGLDSQPDWFDTMQTNLTTAKEHADFWIEDLGPRLFATIPQSIINYNNTFINATNDILGIIKDAAGNPTDAQKNSIIELLQATLTRLEQQKSTIKTAQSDLVTFSEDIQTDHNNLLEGNNGAIAALHEDQDKVIEIQGKIVELNQRLAKDKTLATVSEIGIGVSIFLAVAGFALAIATGGAAAPLVVGGVGVVATGAAIAGTVIWNDDITQDLKDINDAQNELDAEQAQVSALKTIICTVEGLVMLNESAQTALSQILDMYETLSQKMTAVISDLEQAQADEVGGILQKLDVESAQTAWGQLEQFAEAVEQTSMINQGTMDAPQEETTAA
ncbi:HBL/NHE enterotoxin family protein [Pseudoalteromonas obscura]|uniref:HBL/NHE enterotoxin family protein n=1 Tax=Pseudoalteromonas obscura TaxID=3048491 RepID=A0ABT7EPF5_9GAMM|nr:HBL/NHE enterotoxin family protein [Pseudoalteromonas sp. P94(2023)]MDK2596903.1 HBL/NHE enterotoxin family protein [Pseudoalteromonas sp. P94(2023)]